MMALNINGINIYTYLWGAYFYDTILKLCTFWGFHLYAMNEKNVYQISTLRSDGHIRIKFFAYRDPVFSFVITPNNKKTSEIISKNKHENRPGKLLGIYPVRKIMSSNYARFSEIIDFSFLLFCRQK